MAKSILLIRHGQGDHNRLFAEGKTAEALSLVDPGINDVGVKQAYDLGGKLRELMDGGKLQLDLIITSPMKRALMTTDTVFGPSPPCPVIVSPLPTELGDGNCDYGSPRSAISSQFPHLDFSLVKEEEWWTLNESQSQLIERIGRFKDFLLSRPESRIAVVSHGRFLTCLVGDDGKVFNSFWNCDAREVLLDKDGLRAGELLVRVEEPW